MQPANQRDVNAYPTAVQTVVGLIVEERVILNLLFSFSEIYRPDTLSLLLTVMNVEVNLLAKMCTLVSERQITVTNFL